MLTSLCRYPHRFELLILLANSTVQNVISLTSLNRKSVVIWRRHFPRLALPSRQLLFQLRLSPQMHRLGCRIKLYILLRCLLTPYCSRSAIACAQTCFYDLLRVDFSDWHYRSQGPVQAAYHPLRWPQALITHPIMAKSTSSFAVIPLWQAGDLLAAQPPRRASLASTRGCSSCSQSRSW